MIIFFHGADAYRSREKVAELKKQYLLKNPGGTGLFELAFDGEGDVRAGEALLEALGTGGLFAAKKFVVARGLLQSEESARQSVLGHLRGHPDIAGRESETILLFWETVPAKKSDPLYKFLDKHALLRQVFDPLSGAALERWAVGFLSRIEPSAKITREALSRVLGETGSDLYRLGNELTKLALYADGTTIDTIMVDRLVPMEALRDTVFAALDRLASGDRKGALRLFSERVEAGENAHGMLGLCAWQLRTVYLVADAYHAQGLRSSDAIARVTGLKPFQAGKVLRQVGGFPVDRVRRGFSLLAELDMEAKSGGTDPALALEMFVMKF